MARRRVSLTRGGNGLAAISTIMACMSTDRSNTELLAVALDLAQRFSAAVIGVFAKQLSMHPAVLAIGPGEPRGHELDKFRERLAVLEAEFRSALSIVNNLQWRAQMTAGPTSHYLAAEARAVDLLVANSESDDRKVSALSEIDVSDLLMRCGRPVLLAPPGVTGLKLTRTLVCWKESRESRRAVADALPILKSSDAVDVVELVDEQEIEPARARLADVGDWLHRHGVEASCFATPLTGVESAHLAAIAEELEADLVVAGAFAHSRLREWAFGSVTQDLLARGERCAFVSH
jgi:nucleotide-binding universal stress UspA family protein